MEKQLITNITKLKFADVMAEQTDFISYFAKQLGIGETLQGEIVKVFYNQSYVDAKDFKDWGINLNELHHNPDAEYKLDLDEFLQDKPKPGCIIHREYYYKPVVSGFDKNIFL